MSDAPRVESERTDRGEDPLDRLEEVTERTAAVGLARFARLFGLHSWPLVRFVFPLVVLAAGAVVLSVATWRQLHEVWAFIGIYFAPLGIETGIPAGIAFGLSPYLLVSIVIFVDLFGGLFLVWNLEHLFRIPRLGAWLRKVEAKGAAKWEKHKRLRDLGVVGLTVFVFLPISGSGAVPGSIIGRVAGFPWPLVWMAIFIGSSVRVVAYTLVVVGVFEQFAWAGR